jgi:hypothetical protein
MKNSDDGMIRKMKPRWLKRLLIGLGVVVLFPIVLVLLFALTAPLWQRKWIEPVPGVRLDPSRPMLLEKDVDPDSAFGLLRRACALEAKIKKPDDFKKESQRIAFEPWSDEAFPATSKMLAESREALALVRRAIESPNQQVPAWTSPNDDMSYLTQVIDFARIYRAGAAERMASGDRTGALGELSDAMRMSDILSRGGTLLQRLVEITCEKLACQSMRRIALETDVPAEAARTLIDALLSIDKNCEPFAEAFRQETPGMKAAVEMCYDPSHSNWQALIDMGVRQESDRLFCWSARHAGWIVGSTPDETLKNIRARYSHLIQLAARPYDAEQTRHVDSLVTPPENGWFWFTVRDPYGLYLETRDLVNLADLTTKHLSRILDLRATATVLAIRQFQQAEKHPPNTLEELVPRWLPAVPRDPFDDKPLRYRVNTADGTWIVYSVGPDQKDDGGFQPEKRPTSYKTPGDLIYPSTEVEDERAKLKK